MSEPAGGPIADALKQAIADGIKQIPWGQIVALILAGFLKQPAIAALAKSAE